MLKLLVTFQTIGAAFDFQKAIKGKPLSCEITLTPRCLGVTCSYSALIEYQQDIDLADFFQNNVIVHSKLYQINVNDKGQEIYEPYDTPMEVLNYE
jgi:hypothetical protein